MSASVAETEFVFGRMSGISRFIYEVLGTTTSNGEMDYTTAGYVLFALVFLMSALVFKLGFAKKLKATANFAYLFIFVYRLPSSNISCVFPSNRRRTYCGGTHLNHLPCPPNE